MAFKPRKRLTHEGHFGDTYEWPSAILLNGPRDCTSGVILLDPARTKVEVLPQRLQRAITPSWQARLPELACACACAARQGGGSHKASQRHNWSRPTAWHMKGSSYHKSPKVTKTPFTFFPSTNISPHSHTHRQHALHSYRRSPSC